MTKKNQHLKKKQETNRIIKNNC